MTDSQPGDDREINPRLKRLAYLGFGMVMRKNNINPPMNGNNLIFEE